MSRRYWEPIVIDAGDGLLTAGSGPSQISGAPTNDSRTLVLSAIGQPGGDVSRFVGPDVALIGEQVRILPAVRVGGRYRFDLADAGGEDTAPDWLVELTTRDRDTEIPTTHYLGTRGGWSDTGDTPIGVRSYRVTTPRFDATAGRLALSLAGDAAAMNRQLSDVTMLGYGPGIAMLESGTDADGRVYAAHDTAFEPSATFRVDLIFKVITFDGAAKVLVIKGTSLAANPQFALFIGSSGDLRFRMQNSGGTQVTVAKFSPLLEPDTIYHATGVWTGTDLRVALNGEFGTAGIPSFTAAAAGLTDDLHLGIAPAQPGTHLNGEIYYCAVYVDGPIDLPAITAESYGFATSDVGLVAEWQIGEGSGNRSDNRLDPDVRFLTLENLTAPWDPWVYSKTGGLGDAGQPFPILHGFTQMEPAFGARATGLETKTIAHMSPPSVKFGSTGAVPPSWVDVQTFVGLDRVMAGGETLRVRVPKRTVLLFWGSDGPGGWIEDRYNDTAAPFYQSRYPICAPTAGQQIEISGGATPIDGVYTVAYITRAGKSKYGKRMYLEPPGITITGGGTAIMETLGAWDVEVSFDGILTFDSMPTTRVLASGWWTAPVLATSASTSDVLSALVENRAGATVSPDLATELSDWDGIAIGADWTGKTVREAVEDLIGVLGVSGTYYTGADGFTVARLAAPDPGAPVAASYTDANTREISMIREVDPVGGIGAEYRHRTAYDDGDLTALALDTLSGSDYRWLTEASRRVVAGQTPELASRGAMNEDLLTVKTILVDAAEAKRVANYDLRLLNDGYMVIAVKTSIAATATELVNDQVVIQSERHPALQAGVYARVIGIGNSGADAVLYVLARKETS